MTTAQNQSLLASSTEAEPESGRWEPENTLQWIMEGQIFQPYSIKKNAD
jgi:hypothetical protein